MDPEEWADIFKHTGHVWQRKDFPTKLGGKRRSEAKRLMKARAGGGYTADTPSPHPTRGSVPCVAPAAARARARARARAE